MKLGAMVAEPWARGVKKSTGNNAGWEFSGGCLGPRARPRHGLPGERARPGAGPGRASQGDPQNRRGPDCWPAFGLFNSQFVHGNGGSPHSSPIGPKGPELGPKVEKTGFSILSHSVPNGRVIKYPPKCALFPGRPRGAPGTPKSGVPGGPEMGPGKWVSAGSPGDPGIWTPAGGIQNPGVYPPG